MSTWRSVVMACAVGIPVMCIAQPQPPDVTFTLAADTDGPQPFTRRHRVENRCRYRDNYNYELGKAGTWEQRELRGGPLFADATTGWISYRSGDTWCATSYLLIIADADTMRLEFTDSTAAHRRLVHRAQERWDRDTPEVIRFRKGSYRFEELIADPWAVETAKTFAKRLIAEDDASYQKLIRQLEEHYRNAPPPTPPTAPYVPPPAMTQEQWEAEMAKQPGLKKVAVERVHADTVQVRITGRVMLDGGCASSMPLLAIEMLSDTGWAERLPMHDWQLDCGMASADWTDRQVTIPLAWWVYNFRNGGDGLLSPGTYRLRFRGANMKDMRTEGFRVER